MCPRRDVPAVLAHWAVGAVPWLSALTVNTSNPWNLVGLDGCGGVEAEMPVENEAVEEALEAIWKLVEDQTKGVIPERLLEREIAADVLDRLQRVGLIHKGSEGWLLTDRGEHEARAVIRRARLAERLVTDVIRTPAGLMEEVACHFEHVLRKGVDEAVCTLLGHPVYCPHNRPIPPGSCCDKRRRRVRSVISRLADLENGAAGTVAYLNPTSDAELQKLTAMGVLPGEPISLVRRFPSYVFSVRASQFAVDQAIAEQIFVRVEGS